jgi:hypothetical protein
VHATCHVYRGEQFEQILNENSYVNFHHDASGYPWYAISPDIFNLDHRQIDGEQERLWLYKVDFNRGSALSYVDKQNKSRTRYGIIALLNENNADRFTALGQWRQYMSSKEEVSSALGKMLNIPTWPATVLSDAYRNTGDDSKGEVSIPTDDEIEGYYTSQRVLAPKLRYVLEGIPLLRDFFLDPISEEEPEHGMRPPS